MRILIRGIIIITFTLTTFISEAQPGDPPDPEIPIDGGIGILITAGILLGIKKLYSKYKS